MLVHDDLAAVRRVVPKRTLATRSVRASRSMATRHSSDACIPRRPGAPSRSPRVGRLRCAHARSAASARLAAHRRDSGIRATVETPVVGASRARQARSVADARSAQRGGSGRHRQCRRAARVCSADARSALLAYGRSNPIPPAPGLDYHLAVVLPSIVPQVEFEAVAERTREALRRADIRARVVGIDVP
jgi:hypothetical protein